MVTRRKHVLYLVPGTWYQVHHNQYPDHTHFGRSFSKTSSSPSHTKSDHNKTEHHGHKLKHKPQITNNHDVPTMANPIYSCYLSSCVWFIPIRSINGRKWTWRKRDRRSGLDEFESLHSPIQCELWKRCILLWWRWWRRFHAGIQVCWRTAYEIANQSVVHRNESRIHAMRGFSGIRRTFLSSWGQFVSVARFAGGYDHEIIFSINLLDGPPGKKAMINSTNRRLNCEFHRNHSFPLSRSPWMVIRPFYGWTPKHTGSF